MEGVLDLCNGAVSEKTPQIFGSPLAIEYVTEFSGQTDTPELTVKCHKKNTAPCGMKRGSATTDDQFGYFKPNFSESVYRYNWSTEKWMPLRPSPSCNSGLVIIDGEVTTVGGWDGRYCTNKLFTLQHDQWVEHYPPMNTTRSFPTVVSISDGNYIVVIGGRDGCWIAAVELFHVRSRRWYKLTNLPQDLTLPSATICGSQVHVIGHNGAGYSCSLQSLLSNDQSITSQFEISNILTWIPLPQQPVKWSTAATLCGQLVIVGGEGGHFINSIHQLMGEQWVKIGSMCSDRSMCLVVCPSPDKMMIVGGHGAGERIEECVVV